MRTVSLVISSCVLTGFLAAQPSLRITSPADGTSAHPGESLSVAVEAASPRLIYSNSIDVVIERADSPVSITVYPVVADFTMEQKRYLQVTGLYADKTTADLTQSSRIEYAPSDPAVATVDSQGIVTPVGPGLGENHGHLWRPQARRSGSRTG